MNSYPNEIQKENYIRINNTNIKPTDVAESIKENFRLKGKEDKVQNDKDFER